MTTPRVPYSEFAHSIDVIELRLCETSHVILKPDQLYYFTVDPTCAECNDLASKSLTGIINR